LKISLYPQSNFYIDEFNILSQHKDIETSDDNYDMTLKYYNNFSTILENLVKYFDEKGIKANPENIILYEIMYNKAASSNLVILNKFDSNSKDETLEKLKICHQGRFIVILKNDTNSLVNLYIKLEYRYP
jgi:hypothetical protein